MDERNITFRSLDGYRIAGTLAEARSDERGAVVIVHGIAVDRDEFGAFNVKLAQRLAEAGFRSLRFDLRGHGESDGGFEDLTLCGGISDIAAAVAYLETVAHAPSVHLVGASFGGGLSVLYASRYAQALSSLVLLNPNLDYRRSWLADDDYWDDDAVTPEGAAALADPGWVSHGEFRVGRPLLHELVHLIPGDDMKRISTPTLTIHGNADATVPYDVSASQYQVAAASELITIEGADHGFIEPGDEEGRSATSQEMQRRVFTHAVDWCIQHAEEPDGG